MAKKLVSAVPEERFTKYGVLFPDDWEIDYIDPAYTEESLIEAIGDKEYLLVNSEHRVTKKVMDSCPNLKFIHTEGVGFDKVDFAYAKTKGIKVSNNKGANAPAVAETAIALMLECYKKMAYYDRRLKAESFLDVKRDFLMAGTHEIGGKHIGLIGMGDIGKELAKRLKAWNVHISYYDIIQMPAEKEQELGVSFSSIDEIIKNCDIISLHVPVTPTTINLIGEEELKAMKKTAVLVNTARGEIVDPKALAVALENGEIAHAALDVLSPEPTPADHPLLHLSEKAAERLTLTPHYAGMTNEAFIKMHETIISNMERMEKGEEPVNVVNR